MKKIGTYHTPALLKEVIDLLAVRPGGKYIDATLGGGGHSSEIIKRGGELLGIDQDAEAIEYSLPRLAEQYKKTFRMHPECKSKPPIVVKSSFSNIERVAAQNNFEKVDGIIFDLGVSSHQFETPQRGFSFNQQCPLDMRMDTELSVTAGQLVNGLNEGELYELFSKLGEEKYALRIARQICLERQIKKIQSCTELSEIVLRAIPKRGRSVLSHRSRFDHIHPATRVFQALRIAVNDELNSLREALPKSLDLLKHDGRLAVLSFHSLEDRIVKRFFLEKVKEGRLMIINKKPIIPSKEEVGLNPRARSAKLRVAMKV